MAPFICCSFRKSTSSDIGAIELVDSTRSNGKSKSSASTPNPSSTQTSDDTEPIREIFAAVSIDTDPQVGAAPPEDRHHSRKENWGAVHRKQSKTKLHDVAYKVRERLSHESMISKRSSKRKSTSSTNTEATERQKEVRRATRQRLKSKLLEDHSDEDGGYDDDPVPIKTPRSTFGQHEGSTHISPRQLSKTFTRVGSHARVPSSATATLSRMLIQRGSHLADTSIGDGSFDRARSDKIQNTGRTGAGKRYVFRDESPAKPERLLSRLGRSDTIIHTSETVPHADVGRPSFPDSVQTPLSTTQRLHGIPDSFSGEGFLLSKSESTRSRIGIDAGSFHQKSITEDRYSTLAQRNSPPIRPLRQPGASDVLEPSPFEDSSSSRREHGDLADEEVAFDGIDGRDLDLRPRVRSEGSDPLSVHLHKMHISHRLAPTRLSSSTSSPQTRKGYKSELSFGSTQEYPSLRPSHQSTSSGLKSAKVSYTWDAPKTHAPSSIYSSISGSLGPSHRSSVQRIDSCSDRGHQETLGQARSDTISVPPSRPKSYDQPNGPDANSFSSKHTVNARKLISAEKGILHQCRRNTMPNSTQFGNPFSQDVFDDIAAEIARTNPCKRNLSQGSSDRGRGSSFSVVDGDRHDTGGSIWDKALKNRAEQKRLSDEGSIEGRRKSTRRAGSQQQNQLRELLAEANPYSNLPVAISEPVIEAKPNILKASPLSSAATWDYYPSRTRKERSHSPAVKAGNTISFDVHTHPKRRFSPLKQTKKSRSMNFVKLGEEMIRLYRVRSLELRSKLAYDSRNHRNPRNPTSEDGLVEYPALETVDLFSPPMPEYISSPLHTPPVEQEMSLIGAPLGHDDELLERAQSRQGAESWSNPYGDCVVDPPRTPMLFNHSASQHNLHAEDMGATKMSASLKSTSDEVRASTVDFHNCLEENLRRERDRVLRRSVSHGV